MTKRSGCPFCAAAAGLASTAVVYQSAGALALFPLRPATRGHTLVVPRDHVPDLWALDPAATPPLVEAVLRVAHAIRRGLAPEGLNVITSAGAAATQTVPHLHVHVVPRWRGDGFGSIWPDPGPSFTDEETRETAEAIRAGLA
jgi:histidine triad (HIT) family protein